ncbi:MULTISPECIES: hypothetical protein [unclassified Microbacterium]|uniref:hypothetical protein n=1 Tax=unclassified Microbacterium TaxID=2609290 RepID=UPI00365AFBB9
MTRNSHEVDERRIKRRTVLKGAAWSVPVIAVAASSPLAAASVAPGPATGIGHTLSENCNTYRLQVWAEDDAFNRVGMVGATVTATLTGDLTGFNGTLSGATLDGYNPGPPAVLTGTATSDTPSFLGDQHGDFSVLVTITFNSGPNAGTTITSTFQVGPGHAGC